MSSHADDSEVKVKRVKKVKKVVKKKEEAVEDSQSADPEQHQVAAKSQSSTVVASEDVVDEAPAPKKVIKKKIIKKDVVEENASPVQTTSVTLESGSGQGSVEVQEVAKAVYEAGAVDDSPTVEDVPKKKLKKKKIVTGDVEPEVVTSSAAVEIKPSEKIDKVPDNVPSTGEVETSIEADKVVDVVDDSLKDVKKKKIIKKKKVTSQPAEGGEGIIQPDTTTTTTTTTTQDAVTTSKMEKATEETLKDLHENVEEGLEKDAKLDSDLKSSVAKISIEDSLQTEVKPKDEEFEATKTKLIKSDLPTDEFEIKSKEEIPTEVDSDVTSKGKSISIDGVEDKYLTRSATALEGMDDVLGVSKSRTTIDKTDFLSSKLVSSDVPEEVSEAALARQKTRGMMLELENAILIESSRISRDPNRILLSPTMQSMKTLVAREEKLQNDLRSIRQSYGNLDAELEHIRHEMGSRSGPRYHPSTAANIPISSGYGSSSYRPSSRIVLNL